ncbi:MAG: arsenite efflux transporter metallochaperone ArsD [Planctomycetaceae bacterium]|nr:arsenite efflux transporter metallochaperone ArsD [Planctomycetaceae bacterium]
MQVTVYDPPMCCSTGVCGPVIDPVLPRFAADLEWLKQAGVSITRYNLAQQPGEFASNPIVQHLLSEQGLDILPLVQVEGHIVCRGKYPQREELARWTAVPLAKSTSPLTLLDACDTDSNCCGGSGCC